MKLGGVLIAYLAKYQVLSGYSADYRIVDNEAML
jgi:hypothetical protein